MTGPVTRFAFAFAPAYQRAATPFGIRASTAEVIMDARLLMVRFGPWRVRTSLTNVTEAHLEGPYAFWRTAGPARLAVSDRGLTFATNGDRGVRLVFRRAVPGIEPLGVVRHPELTVTVADPEGFVEHLRGYLRDAR